MSDHPDGPDTAARLSAALGPNYEVRLAVGRGGFAEVFEVWDRELERRLAVKVLRPDIAWTSGMLQRFKQEARAVAGLQHTNVLPIHFVGEGHGLVFYAMPYVEGESLGDVLRTSGALSPERAIAVAIPVLEALSHAHAQALVHRDIKPDNIMLDRASGRPLLVDFGIAKRLDTEAGLTQTGFVVGTPHYMSPEQALGQSDLDARSDLYSFGAVLFQMVTGSPPFEGDSSQEIVGKHIAEPPPDPAELDTRIPGWLSTVITRCLEKKPEDRYQSGAMVLEALRAGPGGATKEPTTRRAVAGVDTGAKTEIVQRSESPPREQSPTRQWGVRLALVVLPLVVAASVVLAWVSRPRLVFENPLTEPVQVRVADEEHVVEPGERVMVRLRRRRPSAVLWTLVPPTDTDGTPLGMEISGAFTIDRPRGRILRAADASPGDRAYFAPLITNDTGGPLTVIVNAGTGAALPCSCTIPPGATRMAIGYYPLFQNSTVRVEDPSGRAATFTDLGAEVERTTGVVRLRFEARDLR
ncbi:MAG: serine/threonine protein kinase [Gemmatimonadota bacterium]|nr:serine/threonine protein kinase [Gemmatimonadota bacterium]MDH3367875.1 serine/threonine protein kinase [Gemmatimonadota bacterium]MDH3478010.1 serine/threonine protein kinase [Gemmatimonadota bacterium]MDH3568796.1 serine/threonine protein kinase [Gemmatimonadota bacterium]MDH5549434.1 serine/threonine protein kinase [Gemmatimonadota bacterium]